MAGVSGKDAAALGRFRQASGYPASNLRSCGKNRPLLLRSPMATIGFDARCFAFPNRAGKYCRNILPKLVQQHQDCGFVLWVSSEMAERDLPWAESTKLEDRISVCVADAPLYDVDAERVAFRDQINDSAIDLFFSVYNSVPTGLKVPSMQMIHDLSLVTRPELHPPAVSGYFQGTLRESLRSAHTIVANSAQTAADLERFAPESTPRTWVIPPGVDQRFFARGAEDAQIPGLADLSDYILYSGSWEPWGNLERILQAYARSSLSGKTALVVAIPSGSGWSEARRRVQELKLQETVRIVPAQEEKTLVSLYQKALILLHPVIHEGCGMTVLEAMASGVAVLTSDCAGLPELVGDAALLVDPLDELKMAESLETLVGDDALREDLGARGEKRAQHFTWHRTSDRLLHLADDAIASHQAALKYASHEMHDLLRLIQ